MVANPGTFAVIICAFSEERWDGLAAALAAVRTQTLEPAEIILVVDHNDRLARRARRELEGVVVVTNAGGAGLSGARNTGVAAARSDFLAFIDDDALASPDWLAILAQAFTDGSVIGAGGSVRAAWEGRRPAWFPPEFDWVVGCSYRGLPEEPADVRNLIGCSMAFRRGAFAVAGGFSESLGRIGKVPLGCEETEFCIRVKQHAPGSRLRYLPASVVQHRVPAGRMTWRYFRARCYAEGLSKAIVARAVGAAAGLSAERAHVARALPRAVGESLGEAARKRDWRASSRAGAVLAGLALTGAGYVRGTLAGDA